MESCARWYNQLLGRMQAAKMCQPVKSFFFGQSAKLVSGRSVMNKTTLSSFIFPHLKKRRITKGSMCASLAVCSYGFPIGTAFPALSVVSRRLIILYVETSLVYSVIYP